LATENSLVQDKSHDFKRPLPSKSMLPPVLLQTALGPGKRAGHAASMKLYASLLVWAAMPVCAAEPQLLSFGPVKTDTARVSLNIRSSGTTGFVLLEHGRADTLMVAPQASLLPQSAPVAPTVDAAAIAPPPLMRTHQTSLPGVFAKPPTFGAATPAFKLKPSQLQRRQALAGVVSAAAEKHRLPKGLVDAVILAESKYEPHAVSHAGAAGMMQLMPGTAADLGVANRFNPIANIEAGARYLRQMIDTLGSVRLGVAAYNAGVGSVRRAGGVPNNGETPTYVSRVLGYWSALAGAGENVPLGSDPSVSKSRPSTHLSNPGIERITVEGTQRTSMATNAVTTPSLLQNIPQSSE
jgi:Transglycosylase SLT domain